MTNGAVRAESRLWVPSAYGYRHSLGLLAASELHEAAQAAEAEAWAALIGPGGADPLWRGRAGAVVVYAMWALKELRRRGYIDVGEYETRLAWLADAQRRVPKRERADSWLRPSWWGSEIHARHRLLLIGRSAGYEELFSFV